MASTRKYVLGAPLLGHKIMGSINRNWVEIYLYILMHLFQSLLLSFFPFCNIFKIRGKWYECNQFLVHVIYSLGSNPFTTLLNFLFFILLNTTLFSLTVSFTDKDPLHLSISWFRFYFTNLTIYKLSCHLKF